MSEEKKISSEEVTETPAEESVITENTPEPEAESADKGKDKKKKQKKLESELAAREKELAEAQSKLQESEDKYLRTLAEYDNFRKRSVKEKESIYADSIADALKNLLPVLDTLERAALAEGDAESLHKGIELTLKSFTDALTKLGVSEIDCLGKEFDPNTQQAVFHVEDEAYGENEVIEVLMKGYEKDGKVIRHPMVKVAN